MTRTSGPSSTRERRDAGVVDLADQAIETLRKARFPVYAIAPSGWPGDTMLGGAWGQSLAISLRYDEDLRNEHPERRIEIETTGPEGLALRPPHEVDLASEFSYSNQIINFTHPFMRLPERPVPGSERFNADLIDGKMVPKVIHLPSAGPRRLLEPRPFRDEGLVEPVEFEEHPDFRLYRLQLPEVEVIALSWGYQDDHVAGLISEVQPLGKEGPLFEEVARAEYAAWEKIKERKEQGDT